ncbi:hypothetical protein DICSQDRAFT_131948 [Dichomitus squalens LYAD-421 SS1]|uniref:uncharacterized protein n=1 Tax=Dichomitus squalens (strain LYAD-421) TaxID=732165 RepID=UPI000441145C|nr:uncharacterized protein DICSQDRAFT_131948 [Dichomitus squalens LYAD-421 SS1]EJF65734.1 hypothetical protein DICSQDRAFT_131948 [Dichomitus squalens LYAD-421 SS1]
MVSPDQALTAPPSRRTPLARRSSGRLTTSVLDPHQPWQQFLSQAEELCGTYDAHNISVSCWVSQVLPVVGSPKSPCEEKNAACASSYISVMSMRYTSLYTSSTNNPVSSSSITATSTSHTLSSTPPGTSANSPTSVTQVATSSNDTTSTAASPGGTGGASAGDSQGAPSIPASIVSTPSEDSPTTGPPAETDSSLNALGPSPSAVAHGGSPHSGLPSNATTSTRLSASKSSPNAGAIAGGVTGGLLIIALLGALAFFFRRQRRKARIPPSAEFMHMARGGAGGPELAFVSFDPDTPTKHIPLARQSSIEDDERPPAFTPGSYSDPILEKVHASAAMRDQYGVGHEEGGFEAY